MDERKHKLPLKRNEGKKTIGVQKKKKEGKNCDCYSDVPPFDP